MHLEDENCLRDAGRAVFVFMLGILLLGETHSWRGLFLLVGGVYLVAAD
jgi:hypothetical protein